LLNLALGSVGIELRMNLDGYDMIHKMPKLNFWLLLITGILVLLPACNNETCTESTTHTSSSSPQSSVIQSTAEVEPQGLKLSDALKRNCGPNQAETRNSFRNVGLEVGTVAVDFTLRDTFGNEVTLSELLVDKPVVMVFGSFT